VDRHAENASNHVGNALGTTVHIIYKILKYTIILSPFLLGGAAILVSHDYKDRSMTIWMLAALCIGFEVLDIATLAFEKMYCYFQKRRNWFWNENNCGEPFGTLRSHDLTVSVIRLCFVGLVLLCMHISDRGDVPLWLGLALCSFYVFNFWMEIRGHKSTHSGATSSSNV